MARAIRRTQVNECRRCSTFCDRVIRPATCVAAGCPSLYQYDDPLSGRRFMGCLHKVFATEIDVAMFEEAERTRAGFGAVRLSGAPLQQHGIVMLRLNGQGKIAERWSAYTRFIDD